MGSLKWPLRVSFSLPSKEGSEISIPRTDIMRKLTDQACIDIQKEEDEKLFRAMDNAEAARHQGALPIYPEDPNK